MMILFLKKFLKPFQWFLIKGSSVQFSCSAGSDSLWPYGLQHTSPPCPSPTPGVYSEHMSIESVMPSNHLILCCPLLLLPSIFSSIRVFQMSQFFTSRGQSTGASASASVLPMNIQDWFPLGLTGLTSLQYKGFSRIFSNTRTGGQCPLWRAHTLPSSSSR